jgi:hypothetical protein
LCGNQYCYTETQGELNAKAEGEPWFITITLNPSKEQYHREFEEYFPDAWTESKPWLFIVLVTLRGKDINQVDINAEGASQGSLILIKLGQVDVKFPFSRTHIDIRHVQPFLQGEML